MWILGNHQDDRLQTSPRLLAPLRSRVLTPVTGNEDLSLSSCISTSLFLILISQTYFLCVSRFSSTLLSWSQEFFITSKSLQGVPWCFVFFLHMQTKNIILSQGKHGLSFFPGHRLACHTSPPALEANITRTPRKPYRQASITQGTSPNYSRQTKVTPAD